MMYQGFLVLLFCALSVLSQQIVSDPGVFGPSIELVHLYNDEYPSGMTLAKPDQVPCRLNKL